MIFIKTVCFVVFFVSYRIMYIFQNLILLDIPEAKYISRSNECCKVKCSDLIKHISFFFVKNSHYYTINWGIKLFSCFYIVRYTNFFFCNRNVIRPLAISKNIIKIQQCDQNITLDFILRICFNS